MILLKKKNNKKGFTLVEIMVTLAILGFFFGIITGIFTISLKSQKRALIKQELFLQGEYVMEYLAKQLALSSNISSTTMSSCTGNVNFSYATSVGSIRFVTYDDNCIRVGTSTVNNLFQRVISGGSDWPDGPLTSDKFEVKDFNIRLVQASSTTNHHQPRITIYLRMKAKSTKEELAPEVEFQTTISLRNLND